MKVGSSMQSAFSHDSPVESTPAVTPALTTRELRDRILFLLRRIDALHVQASSETPDQAKITLDLVYNAYVPCLQAHEHALYIAEFGKAGAL